MRQQELLVESFSDALTELVYQLGGAKRVGLELWPEKSAREAGNQLSNCLNPEHPQKLSLEQIDLLMEMARKQRTHVVAQYIGERYGYKLIPVEPEDIKADIANRLETARDEIKGLLKEWEKVQ